ncbi:MAG: hypothetical protein KKB66_11875 [Alphaproteobacteria bacterium]|jgi:hypothetical protein|nr:hypothetical protein [Alphaproteobacteria bacterium]MBU0805101.1 hypothetical protein [Alphaproteobacteria bacterium]MBU0870600.1 hypothetical protein [Alphaproteobacteria bacterium]MBU1401725.1 hypothetical protein [Alphaproteobacteria bacterium]MBU1591858.1 hypothetical protein [Alphaproteobacteria bacterium]
MKKIAFAVVAMMALAGCTTAENDAALGGTAGAVIGGLATGDAGGAIVGGVVGAASGVLIGKATRTGWCRYRDRNGRIYEARCR